MARAPIPLNALRAFESAARHLSFTRAADELCVTQAAISHQVKALERLMEEDAAADRSRNFGGNIAAQQPVFCGPPPTPVEDQTEDEDVGPIGDQGGAEFREFREQRVEKSLRVTAKRNASWIQVQLRSERSRWFSCVCWPTKRFPG